MTGVAGFDPTAGSGEAGFAESIVDVGFGFVVWTGIGVEVAAGVEVGLVIGAAIDFSIVLDTGSGMYRYGVAPALKEKKEKHENKGKDKMGY